MDFLEPDRNILIGIALILFIFLAKEDMIGEMLGISALLFFILYFWHIHQKIVKMRNGK